MAISGPKGAEPTLRGWINPKTGELLKSQRITQDQIDEWHGVIVSVHKVMVDTDDVVSDNNNDGVIDEIESMTKTQIEEFGREHGIELDRRKNKTSMIEDLKAHLETL